jgi:hypothetical protein
MTQYDESTRRCVPATAPNAVAAGLLSARTIAQAAARTTAETRTSPATVVDPVGQ